MKLFVVTPDARLISPVIVIVPIPDVENIGTDVLLKLLIVIAVDAANELFTLGMPVNVQLPVKFHIVPLVERTRLYVPEKEDGKIILPEVGQVAVVAVKTPPEAEISSVPVSIVTAPKLAAPARLSLPLPLNDSVAPPDVKPFDVILTVVLLLIVTDEGLEVPSI